MIASTAIASIVLFIGAFCAFRIPRIGAGVLAVAKDAVASMRDKSLDDEAREKIAQSASIQLLRAFFSILVRSALAVLISFLPIWAAGSADLATVEDVLRYLSRWDVIMIASAVSIVGYFVWARLWLSR